MATHTTRTIEVVVPQVGEGIADVTLLRWLKQEGDSVKKGEPLFEVDTAKAQLEVEAFTDGILREILVPAGSEVMPLQRVALLTVESAEALPVARPLDSGAAAPDSASATTELRDMGHAPPEEARDVSDQSQRARRSRVSPRARALARQLGIAPENIVGSGPGGLITSADVERAHQGQNGDQTARPTTAEVEAPSTSASSTRLRQIIGERMTMSKREVPHFYLLVDVDMAAAQSLRKACVAQRRWEHAPSITSLIVRACALALATHQTYNVSYQHGTLIQRSEVNIGVAVASDDGLRVPVLSAVDRLRLRETAEQLRQVAERARHGRLFAQDFAAKSMSVSNLGMFGVDAFLAIIDIPDPLILSVGQVTDRVVPVNGELAVRPYCTLGGSFDHRVIDGAGGAEFLVTVKRLLEQPDALLGE